MKRIVSAFVIIMLVAGPALAGSALSDWANSSSYPKKVPGMMGRGAANALITPFDLLMGPVKECQEKGGWACPLTGTLRGAEDLLDRGGRALVDIGGSVFPKFNGFPDYKPCPLTGKSTGNPGK